MEDFNKLDNSADTKVVVEEVITPEPLLEEEPIVVKVEDPTPPAKKSKVTISADDVVVYSKKKLTGVSEGYSKVNKDLAKQLLTNKNVRLATEEEIKQHFNK